MIRYLYILVILSIGYTSQAQVNPNPFEQIDEILPTPNSYRNAAGAPGPDYWQQKVDYKMDITLNDTEKKLAGYETITYTNNSPDNLNYLWVQLDQNVRAKDSDSHIYDTESIDPQNTSLRLLQGLEPTFDGGFKIEEVSDANGNKLNHVINKTMMRIDLPRPIPAKGGTYTFNIKWWYNIPDSRAQRARSGYEQFADGNRVYCMAQFYPRLCKYNDVMGWQNKQFYGRGEFTLEFGDFEVNITTPKDHIVGATGELQNPNEVLTREQRNRLKDARSETVQPVMIQTLEEAMENSKDTTAEYVTWKYKADNVRDFAFGSSRRFIWDAMGVKLNNGKTVMAQSLYVPEGYCLWNKYSTKAVAHTVKWYSHYTFDYPYPNAYSIDGYMGMEYPMITFNYGRCEPDGTYTQRMKYGHIGVIIHEIGHNWFPMIVNSDERQWTWMDEGLNTYVQFLTEQQWERNYPHRRGPANKITDYMGGDKSRIVPIMSNSENIIQFGNNAYGKPATALNILRETVVGRELFDYAFKEYANRWKFKNPYPADFFRTIEDASGVDLDWFWKGWFYTNHHVDQELVEVNHYQLFDGDLVNTKRKIQSEIASAPKNISAIRQDEIEKTYDEIDTTLRDFYTSYDPYEPDVIDEIQTEKFYESLTPTEKAVLDSNKNYYELTITNNGELPMPVIVQFQYEDGTTEDFRIPAMVWRYDQREITKIFPTTKVAEKIVLDPYLEIADTDYENNSYPRTRKPTRFEAFKNKRPVGTRENPMQRARRAQELKSKTTEP